MKSAVCFSYLFLCLAYLLFGDSSIIWGGINIITQTAFIGFISYFLKSTKTIQSHEIIIFDYVMWLSIVNSFYIAICMFRNKFWVIYQTDIFAYIMGITIVVLLGHIGYNKNKFK